MAHQPRHENAVNPEKSPLMTIAANSAIAPTGSITEHNTSAGYLRR